MTGRHPFARLRAKMSPEAQARAASKAAALREEMDLAEVRRARELSQEELARTLRVGQAAVAKLEKRTDMYVSTLRRYVRAAGGELEIVARFPDHDVRIRTFSDLRQGESAPSAERRGRRRIVSQDRKAGAASPERRDRKTK